MSWWREGGSTPPQPPQATARVSEEPRTQCSQGNSAESIMPQRENRKRPKIQRKFVSGHPQCRALEESPVPGAAHPSLYRQNDCRLLPNRGALCVFEHPSLVENPALTRQPGRCCAFACSDNGPRGLQAVPTTKELGRTLSKGERLRHCQHGLTYELSECTVIHGSVFWQLPFVVSEVNVEATLLNFISTGEPSRNALWNLALFLVMTCCDEQFMQ